MDGRRLPQSVDQLCSMIRSKNAGTAMLTFDLIARDRASFDRLIGSGCLAESVVAELYGLQPEEVSVYAVEDILAIKITVPRAYSTGAPDDRDVYGCQQAAPIGGLPV